MAKTKKSMDSGLEVTVTQIPDEVARLLDDARQHVFCCTTILDTQKCVPKRAILLALSEKFRRAAKVTVTEAGGDLIVLFTATEPDLYMLTPSITKDGTFRLVVKEEIPPQPPQGGSSPRAPRKTPKKK